MYLFFWSIGYRLRLIIDFSSKKWFRFKLLFQAPPRDSHRFPGVRTRLLGCRGDEEWNFSRKMFASGGSRTSVSWFWIANANHYTTETRSSDPLARFQDCATLILNADSNDRIAGSTNVLTGASVRIRVSMAKSKGLLWSYLSRPTPAWWWLNSVQTVNWTLVLASN